MKEAVLSNRRLVLLFALSLFISSVMYSCSHQRSLAQIHYDTLVVPKQYRPKKANTSPVLPKENQVPQPLKMPSEEQKTFNKKLGYVLNNAENSFNNIDLIRADIGDLKSLIIDRAVYLRNTNDSLIVLISALKNNQIQAFKEARIADIRREKEELRSQKEREQNQAYRDAFVIYSTVGITIFGLLLVGVIGLWFFVYKKTKYLKTHFSHV